MSLCQTHAHLVGKFPAACPACLSELKRASVGWGRLCARSEALEQLSERAQSFFDDPGQGYAEAIRIIGDLADQKGRV